jgi:hypothetical protein
MLAWSTFLKPQVAYFVLINYCNLYDLHLHDRAVPYEINHGSEKNFTLKCLLLEEIQPPMNCSNVQNEKTLLPLHVHDMFHGIYKVN